MTIQDKWNCFKARLFPNPAQTPITNERAERIQRQVADLELEAQGYFNGLTGRVIHLERRSESVDAFYVKTVTTALSERQDAVINKVWRQWAEDSKAASMRVDALIVQIDSLVAELRAANARIDTVSANHAKLIAKLRAGLGEG